MSETENTFERWKTEFGCPLCGSNHWTETEKDSKGEIVNSFDYCYCVDENGESTGESYIRYYVKDGKVVEE